MAEQKFTAHAEHALRLAQQAAEELGHGYVGCEHLLLGLLREDGGTACRALTDAGVSERAVRGQIVALAGRTLSGPAPTRGLTVHARGAVEAAAAEALRFASARIGTEHLLLGLLRGGNNMALRVLAALGVPPQRVCGAVVQRMREPPRAAAKESGRMRSESEGKRGRGIAELTCDLTALARAGRLDPVIGRDGEIARTLQILTRRTKNNPVLLGEAGVGKTAIAEGIAQKIAFGDVPEELLDKRLLSLDLAGMVAGTKYRGEFEERIRGLLDEVRRAGNVILFLDEVHTIVGAGGAEGAVDAANILKPALGRGEIRILGATTRAEYHRSIEKDAALARRFQAVAIDEPTREEAMEILIGLRPRYEQHHRLTITDEALRAAVELSGRYLSGRYLPDKAIDLMDEAASRVRMDAGTSSPEVRAMEEKAAEARRDKAAAIAAQDYERAAKLRDVETNCRGQAERERAALRRAAQGFCGRVTQEDVAKVVEAWTGIPSARLTERESERLLRLEDALRERVVGQDEAVGAVARAVRRARAGVRDPNRPAGSFLFLGPTGVGKTELCRALAQMVFGEEKAIIRLDMSEFMERHTVSRLVGSPPGYVGCEEGGQLTEQVRRKPHALVLLDEIEKAHEEVWNLLLQILEDGTLTDAQGRKVDFRSTLLIMTSNLGAREIGSNALRPGFASGTAGEEDGAAFARLRERVMEEVRQTFKPELINRIDETILFRRLTERDMTAIARRMTAALEARAAARGVTLEVEDAAVESLARRGFDPRYGARPLRRLLRRELEDPLAEALLSGAVREGERLRFCLRSDGTVAPERVRAAASLLGG